MKQTIKELVFITLANNLPRLHFSDHVRWRLYKMAGVQFSGPCRIFGPIIIRPIGKAGNISIGAGTFINTETRFGAPSAKISIGEKVLVGPRVMFETMSHGLVHHPQKGRGSWAREIVVEDGVWIAAGVTVIQGVTIGKGSVIAAGAVVTKDIPPFTLAGGIPAKVIKPIDQAQLDGKGSAYTGGLG